MSIKRVAKIGGAKTFQINSGEAKAAVEYKEFIKFISMADYGLLCCLSLLQSDELI
jgi:hypothetical protein